MTAWQSLSTRARRRSGPTPVQLARLARFNGDSTSVPGRPGTGDIVRSRAQTIAYGYHAVIEQLESSDGRRTWCTLAVQLRQTVPTLQIVARDSAEGGNRRGTANADFDSVYKVEMADSNGVDQVFGPHSRRVLLAHRVQALRFQNAHLVIRSVDGLRASPEATAWLDGLVASILAEAPVPLPLGLYGPCPEALSLQARPPRSSRFASRR
ncbi:MAG: hypothetical protein ABI232_06975 [Jatrophihabitantaceae bacterium]